MISLKFNELYSRSHYSIVENELKNKIQKIIDNKGYFEGRGDGRKLKYCSSGLILYLKNLLRPQSSFTLENLICIHPNDLHTFVDNLRRKHPNFIKPNHNDFVALCRIFEGVYNNTKIFIKINFIDQFNFNTCLYCNRNYIYTINKGKKRQIKPEIDHFYPKSIYPILAITFSNLIPSCSNCNGFSGKHHSDPFIEKVVSPYLIKKNAFLFSFIIKNIAIVHPLSGKSEVEVILKKKIEGNCKVFNIELLYSKHNDHVLDLIIKNKIKYSKKHRQYLKSYKGLTFSQSEIDRMILGNYAHESEQNKRPLAKLYQDIGRELKLI